MSDERKTPKMKETPKERARVDAFLREVFSYPGWIFCDAPSGLGSTESMAKNDDMAIRRGPGRPRTNNFLERAAALKARTPVELPSLKGVVRSGGHVFYPGELDRRAEFCRRVARGVRRSVAALEIAEESGGDYRTYQRLVSYGRRVTDLGVELPPLARLRKMRDQENAAILASLQDF